MNTSNTRLALQPQGLRPALSWQVQLCLAAICISASPLAAHALMIERVVAIVNDRPILLSEVRQRSAPILPRVLEAKTESERIEALATLYKDVLERLVDESLIADAAHEMKIRVEREDEDRAIQNVQAQSGLSEKDFWAAVLEQGLSQHEYRQDIRRQLLRLKVLNQRVRGRVNITEEDVKQRYEDVVRQVQQTAQYHVANIFIPLSDKASSDETSKQTKLAKQLSEQANSANFDELTKKHGGSDLGWVKEGDLPEALDVVVRALSVGQVSAPVRGPTGFHVFLLKEVQRGGQIPSYDEVKHTIYRSLIEQRMTREEKIFLTDLRKKAAIIRRL